MSCLHQIPGLGSLIDKLGESLARFVFVTLDPYLKPIMKQATAALSQGSAQVVNNHDQYKVFNDPNDMHPTHSCKHLARCEWRMANMDTSHLERSL